MHNFRIEFSHPWLLLLLIPAVVLTLLPYFRLAKRYRRTRNRITSIVLHLIVMVFAIGALSGIQFSYQITNEENEIIYLVDVSDSEESAAQTRDEFVEVVLQDSQYDGYKVGVVTFGFDQVYAAPLTYQVDTVYEQYLSAELPETGATDIAAALTYAKNLFGNPQTAKIVFVTDGKETDEEALSVVRSIVASGIKLDVAYIPTEEKGYDAQIVGVEFPEYHMTVDEEYTVAVKIQSKEEATATIKMQDNSEETASKSVDLIAGTQTVLLPFTFTEDGLHETVFSLTTNKSETTDKNNEYCSYYYMEVFNKILILESVDGSSTLFVNLLQSLDTYNIDVKNITATDLPKSVKELCAYDQIVLNNISNNDLVEQCSVVAFDEMLNEYVYGYGGGLFTLGGSQETTGDNGETVQTAHAYNREDMYGSLYQQMLPVQAVNYTPPVGVVFCLDTSGSMAQTDDASGLVKVDAAKDGITACLSSLTERDYIGILTFDDYVNTILEMTPRIQESKIKKAIASITNAAASTVLSDAIDKAGQMLRALENVDKRHIVVISDGLTGDTQTVVDIATDLHKNSGITVSVVGISMKSTEDSGYKLASSITEAANGRVIMASGDELTAKMREELNTTALKEVNYETFNVRVNDIMSPLVQGLTRVEGEDGTVDVDTLTLTLDGFYGVKVRPTADLILTGEYNVPLYAQWKYGEGMVGSFMCDLSGVWSASFMSDVNGKTFLKKVVDNLMPIKNIRPTEITAEMKEENYINQLSLLFESLKEGEKVTGQIIDVATGQVVGNLNEKTEDVSLSEVPCYVNLPLSAENGYSRCNFVIRESGLYKIELTKYDADGGVTSTLSFYKNFTYSKEYDSFLFADEESLNGLTLVKELTARSGGSVIEDLENPWEVFEGFITDLDKVYDPRILFMILAIVLFLLDIVVRKFKFKWPHELIREYQEKKNEKK